MVKFDRDKVVATSRKAGGIVLTAATIGLGVWASLILADILTFLYFYWSTANVLQDHNLSEYGAKLVAVGFAGVVSYVLNSILWNMVKRNKRWVPALAGILVLWFGIMFMVSSPYENSSFNIFSGQPGKYYRDQYNRIHEAPRGAKVGPNGELVMLFNRDTAQEFERQSGGQRKTNPFSLSRVTRLFGSNSADDYELYMEIEKIDILPGETDLHFAVKRADNSRPGRFYQPDGWNYLSDENGQTYDLAHDGAAYPDFVDSASHEKTGNSGKWAKVKEIRPDETYRFTVRYPPLAQGIHHLRLHDVRFGTVDVDYQLWRAQIERTKWEAGSQVPFPHTISDPAEAESAPRFAK